MLSSSAPLAGTLPIASASLSSVGENWDSWGVELVSGRQDSASGEERSGILSPCSPPFSGVCAPRKGVSSPAWEYVSLRCLDGVERRPPDWWLGAQDDVRYSDSVLLSFKHLD